MSLQLDIPLLNSRFI